MKISISTLILIVFLTICASNLLSMYIVGGFDNQTIASKVLSIFLGGCIGCLLASIHNDRLTDKNK